MDSKVIHEISPLMGKDVLYIADRRKKEFTYPIHNHEVYELNFVERAPGVRRIVGDSNEVIGEYDLVLITSPDLEHVWEQNTCTSEDIREVTVHFDIDFESSIFARNPFNSMKKMMLEAQKGLAFPMEAIIRVYQMLDTLSSIKDGYYAFIQFLTILYELSKYEGRPLASSSYAKVEISSDSRRVQKVRSFIDQNYRDEIRLPQVPTASATTSSICAWVMPVVCSSIAHAPWPRSVIPVVSITSAILIAFSRNAKAAVLLSFAKIIIRHALLFSSFPRVHYII